MADHPVDQLNGKTPLMVADIPNIDDLCRRGRCGRLITVPENMPPGSEVANLGVLGYDVQKVYQGRGVLEAASMGIDIEPEDLALRCNVICIEHEKIKNHSAGHITSQESRKLIEFLNSNNIFDNVKFHPGVSYRHLLTIRNGSAAIKCTPPHDVPGTPYKDVLVEPLSGEGKTTSDLLNEMIIWSQGLLEEHQVNLDRKSKGKDPANSIWPWSPGHKPDMRTLQELYGIKGAVISAVDLLYGIGVYAGMDVIKVEGATGLYDTNYEGKAKAAIEALKDHDLVYLHIEATDEAGHEGDIDLKIKTIEYLDNRVVKYIIEQLEIMQEEVAIAILPDHPTPCKIRTHTRDAVPFIIFHPGEEPDNVAEYNEDSVKQGYYGLLEGDGFIRALLKIRSTKLETRNKF